MRYLGLGHVFVANMTGNVVFLGFALGGAPGLSASLSLASVAAFLLGAVGGGRRGSSFAPRPARLLSLSTWVSAALVSLATLSAAFWTPNAAAVAAHRAAGLRDGYSERNGTPIGRARCHNDRLDADTDRTRTVLSLALVLLLGVASWAWCLSRTRRRRNRGGESHLLCGGQCSAGARLKSLGASRVDVGGFLVTHVHRDHYSQAVHVRREFGTAVSLGSVSVPRSIT
jgi:hypothetical protein